MGYCGGLSRHGQGARQAAHATSHATGRCVSGHLYPCRVDSAPIILYARDILSSRLATLESPLTTKPSSDEPPAQLHLDIDQLEPEEDAGSDTLSRYRYQAELAVRPCLSILAGEPVERVICEWHEDYVVSFTNASTQLVSVKHLEAARPRWTVRGLCRDGGLAHLFWRWRAAGQRVTCLVQTNSGMRTGADEPADLQDCCSAGDDAGLDRWATILQRVFAEESNAHQVSVEEVRAFLSILHIEDGLPGRRDIEAKNLQELVPAAFVKLGIPSYQHSTMYGRLVDEVIKASCGASQEDVLAALANPGRLDADSRLRQRVAAKTLDRTRLMRVLAPLKGQSIFLMSFQKTNVGPSRLQEKLARAGLGPTTINNARNLRLNWILHLRRWSIGLPRGDAPFSSIKARILDIAALVEERMRIPGEVYGASMMQEFRAELDAALQRFPELNSIDSSLLLGCAFDLTQECKIMWSDDF